MRLSLHLSLWLGCALAAAGPGFAQDRTGVHLFQYGSANSPETEIAFAEFMDLMVEKMPRLASELSAEREVGRLADLALVPVLTDDGGRLSRPIERIQTLNERWAYWRDTGALAILTGRVKRGTDDGLSIRSTFFWGDLGGPRARESIDLDLPFSGAVYDTTNDSHSVAVPSDASNTRNGDAPRVDTASRQSEANVTGAVIERPALRIRRRRAARA